MASFTALGASLESLRGDLNWGIRFEDRLANQKDKEEAPSSGCVGKACQRGIQPPKVKSFTPSKRTFLKCNLAQIIEGFAGASTIGEQFWGYHLKGPSSLECF